MLLLLLLPLLLLLHLLLILILILILILPLLLLLLLFQVSLAPHPCDSCVSVSAPIPSVLPHQVNTTVAFYNGCRARPEDFDPDTWETNNYKIFDPANMPLGTIDIPTWAQVTPRSTP